MSPIRWAADRLKDHATGPTAAPPPKTPIDRVLWGFTRPAVGVRIIASDLELVKAALWPAALLICVCVWGAWLSPGDKGFVRRFYQLFAMFAPMPTILMADHYARMSARARVRMGFGPAEPFIETYSGAIRRVIARAILIALAVAPIGLLNGVPLVGPLVWKLVLAVWAVHWIVVDAFDLARVLRPGQTPQTVAARLETLPSPWFVRLMRSGAARLPLGRGLLEWFANRCDRLARPWRDELAFVERHPSLVVGFALSTVLLLATPVLNLLFRPIILVAAGHVLGRVGSGGAADELVASDTALAVSTDA